MKASGPRTVNGVRNRHETENSSDISFVGFPFAPDLKLDLCWCMLNRHHADDVPFNTIEVVVRYFYSPDWETKIDSHAAADMQSPMQTQ